VGQPGNLVVLRTSGAGGLRPAPAAGLWAAAGWLAEPRSAIAGIGYGPACLPAAWLLAETGR